MTLLVEFLHTFPKIYCNCYSSIINSPWGKKPVKQLSDIMATSSTPNVTSMHLYHIALVYYTFTLISQFTTLFPVNLPCKRFVDRSRQIGVLQAFKRREKNSFNVTAEKFKVSELLVYIYIKYIA